MRGQEDCIWLLLGARGGDNAQIKAVAAQLDLPLVEKQLTYNVLHILPNLLKGASLLSLRAHSAKEIKPPWPRMVIAVGQRSVSVARYIKEQSGGSTRLVQLGRPRANPDHFDLVVTSPQYGLLSSEHVIELPVPPSGLINVEAGHSSRMEEQLTANKSRPFVVMIAGGSSTTATFSMAAARYLARDAQRHTEDVGGSLFALTSPRTPVSVVKTLVDELKPPATLIIWQQPGNAKNNPYAGLLALADEIIVTSDSASMIADGVMMNKPVKIFQLPRGWQGRLSAGVSNVFGRLDQLSSGTSVLKHILSPWRVLRRSGLINPPRQMALLIDRLFENGLAQPFSEPGHDPLKTAIHIKSPVFPVSFDEAIDRIKLLLKV